jgi:hypothetical protein
MLELAPRPDLAQLDDAGLANRLELAFEGLENAKKRLGWFFLLHMFAWSPRRIVQDPRDYWTPSHVRSEIVDILAEIERRKQTGS